MAACADVAWWFGWSVQEIYDLPLDEFADWIDEVNRQVKAKYQKELGVVFTLGSNFAL
ncbi:GpE family phage tail protein [Kingella kingae]|uniref:GpE family phage tail protein n=1 Tax=Kingella kingae TaxID=504 RepID=UPI0004086B60|nr:GpE family phage tail protein [Kingella kingae]